VGLNKAGKGQSVETGHPHILLECSVGDLSGLLSGKLGGSVFSSILNQGLDLGEVGGVSDEVRKFLAHGLLGQTGETIVLLPELFLSGHGGHDSDLNIAEVHSIKHTESSLVSFVSLEMLELARLS
jgi:hypothetical protein